MTIGKKISLACAGLVTLTVTLGAAAAFSIARMKAELTSIVEGPLPGIYSMGLIVGYGKDEKVAMLEHILAESPQEKSQWESTIADLERKFQSEMKTYEKTIQSAQGREQFEKLGPAQQRTIQAWQTILPLSRDGQTKQAMAVWRGEDAVAYKERAVLFDEMSEFRKSTADQTGKDSISTAESSGFWTVAMLAFSVVSGGLLAFFIIRGINRSLTQAVTELSEGASQVTSASSQVSGSSQSLAQGASEQAASLEQTSASGAEMAATTRKNSESSQQAAEHMRIVSQSVATANNTLADMTASMQEIGSSSGKISKIIKVIDEIAFQTNILALNAAVEAARAGEAGMGFAVVADEVRNLAQRSAQAAKDTASLIEDSILKSTEGSKKLGEVAASIRSITEGAGKVKTLIDEVEASSREQAQGIEQISKAVAQMEEVTQRSAASAEETASASEELNAQSQALMAVVGNLEAMAGAATGHSELRHTSVATKRPHSASLVRNSPGLRGAPVAGAKATPALIRAAGHNQTEFPLDDTEFKEF